MNVKTGLIVLTVALLVGAPALAPTATACGFEEDLAEVGPVFVGLECTQPTVYLDGEKVVPPPLP